MSRTQLMVKATVSVLWELLRSIVINAQHVKSQIVLHVIKTSAMNVLMDIMLIVVNVLNVLPLVRNVLTLVHARDVQMDTFYE